MHGTGERNVDAVETHAGCMPLILPALATRLAIDDLVAQIDGLVLTGGRANVEPHHYDGPPFPDDEPIDPERDHTVLPLVPGRETVSELNTTWLLLRAVPNLWSKM